jgi:hypothetical protein
MSKPATEARRRVIRLRHRKKMAKLKAKRRLREALAAVTPVHVQGAVMEPNEAPIPAEASSAAEQQEQITEEQALQAADDVIDDEHDGTEEHVEAEGTTEAPTVIDEPGASPIPATAACGEADDQQEIKEPAENNG